MSHSIYPLNPYDIDLPLSLFGIGYEDDQPHVFRRKGFPIPQLFYCLSGEGTLNQGDPFVKTGTVQKGNFFYLPPGLPHEYYKNSASWELVWIAFSGSCAAKLLEELQFDRFSSGTLTDDRRLLSLFQKIFTCLKQETPGGKLTASALLYEVIVEFYLAVHEKKEQPPREEAILHTVTSYIDENYSADLTLAELAGLGSVSPQYLCRLFQRHLKVRPFEYIALKRIQQAKALLADPGRSIAEVARLTGYRDCSYFCAVFKKQEGLSPSEFRGRS